MDSINIAAHEFLHELFFFPDGSFAHCDSRIGISNKKKTERKVSGLGFWVSG